MILVYNLVMILVAHHIGALHMVFISIVALLLLIIGLITYKHFFPKRKIHLLLLLFLVSFLPLISIFRSGSYESGDLTLHAKYAAEFYENLVQGNIIPRWMGRDCSGYGCPEYMFIFMLPYYMVSLFHYFGFSFIDSVKAVLITSYISGGVGIYIWLKKEFGAIPAFIAAVFYQFAPYHLIDMHFRVSIGEIVSMGILPYIFYFIKILSNTKKYTYAIYTGLTFSCLILAHQATSLMSLPLILLYCLYVLYNDKVKDFKTVATVLISPFLGIALTAFYWLPLLVEKKYIWYGVTSSISFHSFWDYLYSPITDRLGLLFQGNNGEQHLNVGYTEWFVVFFAGYLLIKKRILKNDKILLISSLIIFGILFFFMQSFSRPLWNAIPLATSIQFAWRLLIEVMIIISIIVAIVIRAVPNKYFVIILCAVTILFTILNWGNWMMVSGVTDHVVETQQLFQEKPGTVELTTPIWVNRYAKWIGVAQKQHLQTLSGTTQIIPLTYNQTLHIYSVTVQQSAIMKENTYYFPGWELFVNNQSYKINYTRSPYNGIITFPLKEGKYIIKLEFVNTPIINLAEKISLITFILTVVALAWLILLAQKRRILIVSPQRKIRKN